MAAVTSIGSNKVVIGNIDHAAREVRPELDIRMLFGSALIRFRCICAKPVWMVVTLGPGRR